MKVLLLGGGGREHALAWKLASSPIVTAITSAPGNPGTAEFGPNVDLDPTDPIAVADAAAGCDVVVVGPEAPLAAGVTNHLLDKGIPTFGPSRDAALLETSKSFAKSIMARADVATAAAHSVDTPDEAEAYLRTAEPPYVVKADGLASGKGVLVTDDIDDAVAWADRVGGAGRRILVEEYLDGPELSVFAVCNGSQAVPIGHARDHKRLGDSDTGPNTGGMGAYSPVGGADELIDDVMWNIIEPVVATMADLGTPYTGILYAGLALTADGPKVIEFNCRFGDPEAQVVLPLLTSDLGSLIAAAVEGAPMNPPRFSSKAALAVVAASGGYPEAPRLGDSIRGLDDAAKDALVFHAGTRRSGDTMETAGGRVLSVVGVGGNLAEARRRAYSGIGKIDFDGMQYRSDIGDER